MLFLNCKECLRKPQKAHEKQPSEIYIQRITLVEWRESSGSTRNRGSACSSMTTRPEVTKEQERNPILSLHNLPQKVPIRNQKEGYLGIFLQNKNVPGVRKKLRGQQNSRVLRKERSRPPSSPQVTSTGPFCACPATRSQQHKQREGEMCVTTEFLCFVGFRFALIQWYTTHHGLVVEIVTRGLQTHCSRARHPA